MTDTQKRVASALVLVPTALCLILSGNKVLFNWVIFFLSLGMVYEYAKIVFSKENWAVKFGVFFVVCAGFSFLSINASPYLFYYAPAAVLIFASVFVLMAKGKDKELLPFFQEGAFAVFGMIYVAYFPSFLAMLYQKNAGVGLVLLANIVVWAGDSCAWFVGRNWGKHKLHPVSPKKTIEGTLGGLVFSALTAVVFYHFFLESDLGHVNPILLALLGLFVGFMGQIGDLFESLTPARGGGPR